METTIKEPPVDLGSLIVRSPGVAGGKPRVQGHRIPVHRIAGCWLLGLPVEEIV